MEPQCNIATTMMLHNTSRRIICIHNTLDFEDLKVSCHLQTTSFYEIDESIISEIHINPKNILLLLKFSILFKIK